MNSVRSAEKLCCARSTRLQAVLAVELHQKALPERFLLATAASRVFQQPARIREHPRKNHRSVSVTMSVHQWFKKISRFALFAILV
jgi:hypothetical protein